LSTETPDAVGSETWLSVSFQSVQKFLGMDFLDIEEADLVRALIRWGKFQLQKDGDDPNDGQKLRIKILPGLHLIRFSAVSHVEFVQLCLDGLEEVLSGDEKHSIMMFIVTKDWKQMPAQIAPTKLAPRQKPYIVFHLKPYPFGNYNHILTMTFQVDKKATLAGVVVEGPPSFLENLSINLAAGHHRHVCGRTGRGWGDFFNASSLTCALGSKDFFKITPEVELSANTRYSLTFSGASSPTCSFSFPNCQETTDGLTLTIFTPTISVNLQKIMFRPFKNLAT
jgi:hypothetical protein